MNGWAWGDESATPFFVAKARSEPSFFGRTLDEAFRRFLRRVPKQSRSRVLVESVLEAFDRQVRELDVDDVTVEALTDHAGVGVGSLYEYFSGRDSLLGAFVGRVTRENFVKLEAQLKAQDVESLEDAVALFAGDVVDAYMRHPRRMRALVDGVARLGLLHAVNRERDRFAEVMARQAQRHLPDAPFPELVRSMQLVADAVMGVLVSCVSRDEVPANLRDELTDVALAILRRRHG